MKEYIGLPSKENGWVHMDCSLPRMSAKGMSNLMYAIIMTHATVTCTFGVGIYEYTREQNCYNGVEIRVFIHPSNFTLFEQLSNLKLKEPPVIKGA